MMERIFSDVYKQDNEWCITILRYFNPIGAHPSGDMGEDPSALLSNLVPYLQQVAIGKKDHINVFGTDYDTPDGTCLRDYIHVMDIADGHVKAIEFMQRNGFIGSHTAVALIESGYEVTILDNLSNSKCDSCVMIMA